MDFGSSYTKVCINQLNQSDKKQAEVVTFGNSKKEVTENFLVSKVGIDKDGTLFGGLTESEYEKRKQKDSLEIDFLKMRLAKSLPNNTCYLDKLPQWQKINLNEVENIKILSAYFLAKVIIKTQNWFINKDGNKLDVNNVNWIVNLGKIEFNSSSHQENRDDFQETLWLAKLLSDSGNFEYCLYLLDSLQRINHQNDRIYSFYLLNLINQAQDFRGKKPVDYLNLKDLISLVEIFKSFQSNLQLSSDIINNYKTTSEVIAGAYTCAYVNKPLTASLLFIDIGSSIIKLCHFFYQKKEDKSIEINDEQVLVLDINEFIHQSNLDRQTFQRILTDSDDKIIDELDHLIIKSQKPLKQGESIAAIAKRQHQAVMANNYQTVPYYYITKEAIESELKTSHTPQEKILYQLMLLEREIHLYTAKKTQDKIIVAESTKDSAFFRYCLESTYSAFKQFNKPSQYKPQNDKFDKISIDKDSLEMNGIDSKYSHHFAIAFGLLISKS